MARRRGSRPTSTTSAAEAGTGLVGSLAGTAAFLVLLLLASQVLVHLFALSTVTATAFDAARIVAGSAGGPAAEAAAEAEARRLLGTLGDEVDFEWRYPDVDGDGDADAVRLRVHGDRRPRLLPLLPLDRTVTLRVERWR